MKTLRAKWNQVICYEFDYSRNKKIHYRMCEFIPTERSDFRMLTGVTMRSTRRNTVCNQDWINNANPCTPPCCVCGLWSTDRSVCSVCDPIGAGENKISLQKYTFHYRANNMIHYIRWQFITEGKKFHYRKYWLSCQRKVIHYENLNSLQKFEFITEEHKSITGE